MLIQGNCVGPYTGVTCGEYLDYCAINRYRLRLNVSVY